MDLHPLFVHFPIALLCLYAVLELLRKFLRGEGFRKTREVLVIIGTLSAFITLSTGETVEHMFTVTAMRNVLELHSFIAGLTTWIFAALSACYLLTLSTVADIANKFPPSVKPIAQKLIHFAHLILGTFWSYLLALAGVITLMLTGALGGILVYGPDFDPATKFVYGLFFGN